MEKQAADAVGRQWALLKSIPRFPNTITIKVLKGRVDAEGYSTTLRTLERDLISLSSKFPLVVNQKSRPYGWSWAKDAIADIAPRLSTSESVALLMAQAHLRGLMPTSLLDQLNPMFELASKALVSTGWRDWHQRTAVIPGHLALQAPKQQANVLEDVHAALSAHRQMTGRYRAKGKPDARDLLINPLGLIARGQVQYLVCTLFDF